MSMFKKVRSLAKHGLDPFVEGKVNYQHPKENVEALAEMRAKICLKCPLFEKEPIGFLRVRDLRIKVLSNMMCGDCGCASPYLLRQSTKICKKWQKSTST